MHLAPLCREEDTMTKQQQAVPSRFMRGMQWFMPRFTESSTEDWARTR
jgi:hypothetical protein